jgi:thiol-disulfide isomerase/thioredoxin
MTTYLATSIRFAVRQCALALMALALAGSWTCAAELPRYNLPPGLELLYRSIDRIERKDDEGNDVTVNSTSEWTIDVIDRNPDGSSRLVYRENNVFEQSSGGEEDRRERLTSGRFDLQADGWLVDRNPRDSTSLPIEMFPLLPPDVASLKSTWSDELGYDETRRSYTGAGPFHGEDWSFVEDLQDTFNLVEDRSVRRDYTFDTKRALVRKVTTVFKEQARPNRDEVVSSSTIELVSTRQLDNAELAVLKDETTRYFNTLSKCEGLIDQADGDFSRAAEYLEQAQATMRDVQGQFKLPAVQAMLEQKLGSVENECESTLRYAEHFNHLMGTPSQNWKTTDLDGRPHSLEEYRGRVVVLDFWYRGCGWCITAMPQIKLLAADFRDQPVTVLGMNGDHKLEDAQAVVDRLKLKHVSLRDGEDDDAISKKYGIHGWPTVIVLDGQGVIRHAHVGYSPAMRKLLGDKIRALLAEKPAELGNSADRTACR